MAEEKVTSTREINAVLRKQLATSKSIRIGGLDGHDHVAVGIEKDIKITVEGEAGDFFGALNNGAKLRLVGSAERYLGDTMMSGEIIVDGSVGIGAGANLRGGVIMVKGDSKGQIGYGNKGGTIIIDGNAGSGIGMYMSKGTIVVTGDVSREVGEGIQGGAIYIGGEMEKLGRNATIVDMEDSDRKTLANLFKEHDIEANLVLFEKVVLEKPKRSVEVSS